MILYPDDLHFVEIDHRDDSLDGTGIAIVSGAGAKPASGEGQTRSLLIFNAEVAGRPRIDHDQIYICDPAFLQCSSKLLALFHGDFTLVELVERYSGLDAGNMGPGLYGPFL